MPYWLLAKLTVYDPALLRYGGDAFQAEKCKMDINAAKNEIKVMVVMDLAAICKKLAENSVVPNSLRVQARELLDEFDSLLPARGKGTPSEHAQGEVLLVKMARFLTRVIEIHSWPADSAGL
jgi:hypothetical protein